MKKMYVVVLAVITFQSCSKDEPEPTFEISGKIINSVTNLGVPNLLVEIITKRGGTGYFSGGVIIDIDTKTIKTDAEGNFKTNIPTRDATFFTIQKFDDGNYTGISKSLYINESENIILNIEQFEILKIIVKNTTPYDLNDRIEFGDVSYYLVSRINYGSQNEIQTFFQGTPSPANTWLGTNVNSEITYRVPNSYKNDFEVNVKKNGIWSKFPQSQINIVATQINVYNINY